MVGDINAACADVTGIPLGSPKATSVVLVGAVTEPHFDAREALRIEIESFTLEDAMDYLCDDTPAYSVAFVGVGNCIGGPLERARPGVLSPNGALRSSLITKRCVRFSPISCVWEFCSNWIQQHYLGCTYW